MDGSARVAARVAAAEEHQSGDATRERDRERDERDDARDVADVGARDLWIGDRAAALLDAVADHELRGPGDGGREHGAGEREAASGGHSDGSR